MGADRGERLGGLHEEVFERPLVAGQLGEDVIRRGQRRSEVFRRDARRLAGARVLFGGAHEELLQPFARARIEGVEHLVEVGRPCAEPGGSVAPAGSVGRLLGPGESDTKRPATVVSEGTLTCAVVPSCSGTSEPSTWIVISAL